MKKKFLIISSFLSLFFSVNATVSAPYAFVKTDVEGIDAIVIYDSITIECSLTFLGENFKSWERLNGGNYEFYSNLAEISPDEGGYRAELTNGEFFNIWVFDFKNYRLEVLDLKPIWFDEDKCEAISLETTFNDLKKQMFFTTKNGQNKELERKFFLKYNDIEWAENAWSEPTERTIEQKYPFTQIALPAPKCNTDFELSGDEIAEFFQKEIRFKTEKIRAITAEMHLKATVSQKEAENEVDRNSPTQSLGGGVSKYCKCKQIAATIDQAENPTVGGSAPLTVEFKSNANEDAVEFYEWQIYSQSDPTKKIRYTDKDFRYTFSNTDTYTVRLTASSAECQAVDSVQILVHESFLDAPNVFTPNGDGNNDEFKVLYRSLTNFNGWIYNRWGRLVFKWDDPAKGWDGRIDGKMAAPGAYYFVIQATGADKDEKGKFLEWKCSGDINLLRNKN